MSRSYKHTPYCGEQKDRYMKRYANRKLRRKKLDHDLQYNSYKKDFCSWNICDYYNIETDNFEKYYESCIDKWYRWQGYAWYKDKPFPSREECWKEYHKWYIRK